MKRLVRVVNLSERLSKPEKIAVLKSVIDTIENQKIQVKFYNVDRHESRLNRKLSSLMTGSVDYNQSKFSLGVD